MAHLPRKFQLCLEAQNSEFRVFVGSSKPIDPTWKTLRFDSPPALGTLTGICLGYFQEHTSLMGSNGCNMGGKALRGSRVMELHGWQASPPLTPLIEFLVVSLCEEEVTNCFKTFWYPGGISVFGSRAADIGSRKAGILGSRLRKKSIFRFFLDCPTQPGQGRW